MLESTRKIDDAHPSQSSRLRLRLIVAILQAVALYLLTAAAQSPPSWPASEPVLFVPLFLIAMLVPLILMMGVGEISARALALWAGVATLIILGVGYHDVARGRFTNEGSADAFWPWDRLWLALVPSLFIAHVLVVDAVKERRLFPSYTRHFDTAWKLGVQIVLAAVFLGVFWIVLQLGAALFQLVYIASFGELLGRRWFAYPASALAVAVSLHVTDIRPQLIRGGRAVILALFSWLLPVMVVILLGFFASLPFVSLAQLWATHDTASMMLGMMGLLILFLNCWYGDGKAPGNRIMGIAGFLGALLLMPLAGLAAQALALRVAPYGWTPDRISAAVLIGIAGFYAIGYVGAVVRRPFNPKFIERVNVAGAMLCLAAFLALFSPLADPARLMVANQVGRLKLGLVSPEKFDFGALRIDGARWGAASLAELVKTPEVAIASRAQRALMLRNTYDRWDTSPSPVQPLTERIEIYPDGRTLPARFYDHEFWLGSLHREPSCFRENESKCVARYVALHPGEADSILFFDGYKAMIFEQDEKGTWQPTAHGINECTGDLRDGITAGSFHLEPPHWPNIAIGHGHILFRPLHADCP